MADVKESALSTASDCKWVRALDANGNSIRISKEDLASVVGELIGTTTAEKDGLQAKGYNALSFNQWSNYRGKIVKITFTGTILVNHQHPNHRLAAMCIINNGIYSNTLFKVGSQSELLFGKKDNAFYMQIIGGSTILTISPLYIETPITFENVTGQISSTDIEWL